MSSVKYECTPKRADKCRQKAKVCREQPGKKYKCIDPKIARARNTLPEWDFNEEENVLRFQEVADDSGSEMESTPREEIQEVVEAVVEPPKRTPTPPPQPSAPAAAVSPSQTKEALAALKITKLKRKIKTDKLNVPNLTKYRAKDLNQLAEIAAALYAEKAAPKPQSLPPAPVPPPVSERVPTPSLPAVPPPPPSPCNEVEDGELVGCGKGKVCDLSSGRCVSEAKTQAAGLQVIEIRGKKITGSPEAIRLIKQKLGVELSPEEADAIVTEAEAELQPPLEEEVGVSLADIRKAASAPKVAGTPTKPTSVITSVAKGLATLGIGSEGAVRVTRPTTVEDKIQEVRREIRECLGKM